MRDCPGDDATARFWLVDTEGLLTDDMGERLQATIRPRMLARRVR